MFCRKCGAQLQENAKFCVKCGAPVSEDDGEASAEGKSKKTLLIIAIALLLVLLMIIVGVGISLLLFNNKTNTVVEEKNETEEFTDYENESGEAVDTEEETTVETEQYTGIKKDVNIGVRQIDASKFPEITLYASITDESGNSLENLDRSNFTVQEIVDGTTTDATVDDVYRVINGDHINVNLVMDASGSMEDYSKITQAKNAATALVNQMKLSDGDQVEVISFDDYVYLEQEFTNDQTSLNNAIQNIDLGNRTALYDGLYSGLYQTYYQSGAKCVIGFTDGMENASSYSYQDVVDMSKNTGIPVFIIGIGEEYDIQELQNLANECSGQYYSANVDDLESILEDIYINIYHEQQDYYVFKYKTQNVQNTTQFRDVVVQTSQTSEYNGYNKKSYVPDADVTGAFSGSYMNKDFMIADSDKRVVTTADLEGMSLAELRIARNEIFARHGRQFKDTMLNQWFYSKVWYLDIDRKYAPDIFDSSNPDPLTKLELDNANFIKDYEQNIMDYQDIYPNAANMRLSDYDLALSKQVLKTALSQMQRYKSTTVLEENKRLVQEAIDREDVQY